MRLNNLIGRILATFLLSCLYGCDSQTAEQYERKLITTYVHVSVRGSLLDSSTAVLQLQNLTDESRSIVVNFYNHESRQAKTIAVDLSPMGNSEIGILEGWALKPSETFEITCAGYRSVSFNTYQTERGSVGIKRAWGPGRYIPPVAKAGTNS
jgi:hypothetical protein